MCVTLEAKLPEGYPDEEPVVQLRNPRGLDDTTVNHLYQCIRDKCNEFLGQPVIYELIEVDKLIIGFPMKKYIILANKRKFN